MGLMSTPQIDFAVQVRQLMLPPRLTTRHACGILGEGNLLRHPTPVINSPTVSKFSDE